MPDLDYGHVAQRSRMADGALERRGPTWRSLRESGRVRRADIAITSAGSTVLDMSGRGNRRWQQYESVPVMPAALHRKSRSIDVRRISGKPDQSRRIGRFARSSTSVMPSASIFAEPAQS
jgi:hypothetical protein